MKSKKWLFEKKKSSKKNKILEARARELSKIKEEQKQESGSTLTYITFTTAHEMYAVNILNVYEIQPLKEISYVPHVPDFYMGAVNIRGNILLVFDISLFFRLPEKGIADLTKIIVVHSGTIKRGILAGEVYKTEGLAAEDILVSQGMVSEINEKYISGITKDLVMILNIDTILTDKQLRLIE
ncbi:chemotaxis protein CheW [candidate division CSSED10-310 bacterium]|uniref:Chemotaxis protein CheW n=1 Tax=candidate division CSSED10-310 bacterium TaxID=2855610 RepID=A0ABV6YTK4_UNCC1